MTVCLFTVNLYDNKLEVHVVVYCKCVYYDACDCVTVDIGRRSDGERGRCI